MNKIFTFFFIIFISSTIFSDDVLNETVYWELTRVDAKIEEKKYDEAEDILRYWYKKNWRSRSYNKAVIARTYGFFLFQRERFEEALEKIQGYSSTDTNAYIHELTGDILAEQNKSELAIKQYQLASEKYSDQTSKSIISMKIANLNNGNE